MLYYIKTVNNIDESKSLYYQVQNPNGIDQMISDLPKQLTSFRFSNKKIENNTPNSQGSNK